MTYEEPDTGRVLNAQKFLLHHVLGAAGEHVDQVKLRQTIPLNHEEHWHHEVQRGGSLRPVGRFSAGEDEWVQVFVPSDAPYLQKLGQFAGDRHREILNMLENKGLTPGKDYMLLAVYPEQMTESPPIWRAHEKAAGHTLFLRKREFQSMALEMLAELANFESGKTLVGWRGSEIAYNHAFADDSSPVSTLVGHMARNADFEDHHLRRASNMAEKREFFELAARLRKFAGGDNGKGPGGAMSF